MFDHINSCIQEEKEKEDHINSCMQEEKEKDDHINRCIQEEKEKEDHINRWIQLRIWTHPQYMEGLRTDTDVVVWVMVHGGQAHSRQMKDMTVDMEDVKRQRKS